MRKNSIKNTRINEEVMRGLSNIIHGEIKDPRIHPMTSVVAAEVAPDLKTCKAYISAEGVLRTKLASHVNLRNTPEIQFIMDQSIEYGVTMSKKIDEVNEADARRRRESGE